MICSKCNAREIEDWESMCDYCYEAGKADEEVIEEELLEDMRGEEE